MARVIVEYEKDEDPVQVAYFAEEVAESLRDHGIAGTLDARSRVKVNELTQSSSIPITDLIDSVEIVFRKAT